MKQNRRREFLKTSLAGMFGAALAPRAWSSSSPGAGEAADIPSLPSRTLGRTGLSVPLIGLGTGDTASANLIQVAYDAGIKLFFSATYYGQGNNERLVGEALAGRPRDSYLIGTAAPPEGFNPRQGTPPESLTVASYMKTAEDSLKRFGLDYVDILLLPFADKKEYVLHEPILNALTTLKKQGKTRFLGVASHEPGGEGLRAAVDSGIFDVAMPAYNFMTRNIDAVNESLARAAKGGLGIVAMKTTAGAARDKNRTKPLNFKAALKWVLQNPDIAGIVSAMSSVEELRMNLEMIKDLKMSEQEWKDLEPAKLEAEAGLYCQQCRTCLPQCPYGLDIPTLMRGYMYAYGYRDIRQARYALEAAGLAGRPCENCDVCRVACASGFDVKDRVRDIARLKELPLDFVKA